MKHESRKRNAAFCAGWLLVLLAAAPAAWSATLVWGGDSTTTIVSVTQKKTLFLGLAEVARKLPVTVRSDAEAGLFVLCTAFDCRPVYGIDESELLVIDSAAYVRADAVTEALGCGVKARKRDVLELDCRVPLARVGTEAGLPAPGFRLPDARDSLVTLAGLLARGPVVVAFVRSGDWDPQSRILLTELQARRDSLRGAGVELVAIHGYEAAPAAKWAVALKLDFPQLADHLSAVMRGYGVFDKGNLPHPALFLIDRAGIIRLRQMLDSAEPLPDLRPLMEAVERL